MLGDITMLGLDSCLTFRPLSNKKKGRCVHLAASCWYRSSWGFLGQNSGIGVEQHLIESDPGDFFHAVLDEVEGTGSYE